VKERTSQRLFRSPSHWLSALNQLVRCRHPQGTARSSQEGESDAGLPFRPNRRVTPGITWLVRSALEEAKIEGHTWHCNRDTFASRLVMAGVDLRTVAQLPGHRTLPMVMRHSHLAPEHQASAVDRLVEAGKPKGHQIGHRTSCSEDDQAAR